MRKLIESTFVTLDGVIENPQVWGPPYWDDEHGGYATKLLARAGRAPARARDLRGLRPGLAGAGRATTPTASTPCRSTSRRAPSTETTWNAALLEGDVAEARRGAEGAAGRRPPEVRHRRARPDADPATKLVDELHLWIFPVLAGGGQRLLDGIDTDAPPARRDDAVRLGDRRQHVRAEVALTRAGPGVRLVSV